VGHVINNFGSSVSVLLGIFWLLEVKNLCIVTSLIVVVLLHTHSLPSDRNRQGNQPQYESRNSYVQPQKFFSQSPPQQQQHFHQQQQHQQPVSYRQPMRVIQATSSSNQNFFFRYPTGETLWWSTTAAGGPVRCAGGQPVLGPGSPPTSVGRCRQPKQRHSRALVRLNTGFCRLAPVGSFHGSSRL